MFAHGDSSRSVLTGLLILTILAVYEWLKIYLLYQLVSSVACFEGRSFGELAPKGTDYLKNKGLTQAELFSSTQNL